MRAIAVIVTVVLALGFGVAPEPAMAAPCPGHDGASGVPGHAPHGRNAGTSHGAGWKAATAAGDPAADTRAPRHDQPAPKGPSCCHAASAAVLVSPPEIAPRPGSTRIPVARWLPPPAAPAVGVYRPPALA
jgi:hypothetical protein